MSGVVLTAGLVIVLGLLALIFVVWQRAADAAFDSPTVLVAQAAEPTLWETILQENLVVVSLGLAALPLLAAVGMGLAHQARRLAAWLARQRSAAQDDELDVEVEAAGLALAFAPVADGGDQPALEPEAEHEAPSAPEPQADAPASESETGQPPADARIQDILTSVFETEAGTLKYEVLEGLLMDVESSDLLAISQRITAELQARTAPARNEGVI